MDIKKGKEHPKAEESLDIIFTYSLNQTPQSIELLFINASEILTSIFGQEESILL